MNAMLQPATFIGQEPSESYYTRRLDEANASGLKHMLRSPAHFKHWVDSPEADRDSPALRFGKAALLFQEFRHQAREGRIAK